MNRDIDDGNVWFESFFKAIMIAYVVLMFIFSVVSIRDFVNDYRDANRAEYARNVELSKCLSDGENVSVVAENDCLSRGDVWVKDVVSKYLAECITKGGVISDCIDDEIRSLNALNALNKNSCVQSRIISDFSYRLHCQVVGS